jgi:peptidyl-prolyl cis-trans isomerase A (cyclophilin A)
MRQGRPLLSICFACLALVCVLALAAGGAAAADDDHPVVIIETNMGEITVELDRPKAPATVANFLKYLDDGHYAGTVFHRVIPEFMIQGGGFTEDLKEKPTRPPVKNESKNGLSNTRGTIAMARTNNPDSATSQFFINLADRNNYLDNYGGGYTVFGKVTAGMDVVDKIAGSERGDKVGTTSDGQRDVLQNVPLKPIVIKAIRRKAKP